MVALMVAQLAVWMVAWRADVMVGQSAPMLAVWRAEQKVEW